MRIDLKKMQNKVDKLIAVFTNIIAELNTQIAELNKAIDDNENQILSARSENVQYSEKIKEYEALKAKVESIVK